MLFNKFNHIVVKSPFDDRFLQTKNELGKYGILNIERYSGKLGSNPEEREREATNDWWNIVQMAKDKNWDCVLILEDDIIVDERYVQFNEIVNNFLSNNTWDMFYFGYNDHQECQHITEPVSQNIVRIKKTWTLHAVVVNSIAYDKILALKNVQDLGDCKIGKIQLEGNTYGVKPRMIYQRNGFSYLQNKNTNYDIWLKD